MNDSDYQECIFEGLCKTAFYNYAINEYNDVPSKEELDKMFPIPKNGLKRIKRAVKAKRYGKPLWVVYLMRAAVILLTAVTVIFGALMTTSEVRTAVVNSVVNWIR